MKRSRSTDKSTGNTRREFLNTSVAAAALWSVGQPFLVNAQDVKPPSSGSPTPPGSMRTLFSGGLVFNGDDAPISGRDVLIENGRIAAVRPAGDFKGFAGKTIDITGMTLMPGLIDCHTHLSFGAEPKGRDLLAIFQQASVTELSLRALENAQATLRGGVTSVRDCGDRDNNGLVVRDAFNAGRHLGPTMRCAGRCVCMPGGQGSVFNGHEVDGPDETVKAVQQNITAGVDVIKFTATGACTDVADTALAELSAESLAAGVRAARALGRPSTCHAQGTLGLGNAVRAGMNSIEHGFTMTDEIMADMIKQGVYLVPTLSRFAVFLADKENPPQLLDKVQRWSDEHKKAVMAFHRAGGLVAMGTDTGAPLVRHGENGQELRRMVALGISPLDALRIGTSRGAGLLGLTDRGRVQEGYWADLLIVRGDPSRDIEAASDLERHAYIFKNGFDVLATLGPPGTRFAPAK